MVVDITLAKGLSESWRDRIQRQVDYKLASKAGSIRSLTIRLTPAVGPTMQDSLLCAIDAKLADGQVESVRVTGAPNMCIADAASRLSRSIGRNAERKQKRWQSKARSR